MSTFLRIILWPTEEYHFTECLSVMTYHVHVILYINTGCLKAVLHDTTCRMRLSFWRMKTTANATIPVHGVQAN